MTNIFISVNYDSSSLISDWYESIKILDTDAQFILVDNYSNDLERELVEQICLDLGIKLLLSENVGYGGGLNLAYKYLLDYYEDLENMVIFSGNLDVKFKRLPLMSKKGNYVFVPKVYERGRNRNPFLTKFQSHFLILHKFSVISKSLIVFRFVIILLKLASFFPSRIWAVHGSLFCFNGNVLMAGNEGLIFNCNSFLYSEELEFASFIEQVSGSTLIEADIVCEHEAHATTSKLINNSNDFFEVWSPSFYEWLVRWGKL